MQHGGIILSNLFNYLGDNIMSIIFSLPALLITITLHELAHGYVAYKLGDPTAKDKGRLTLNPIKHIDPMGFLALIIFQFGWAKPVPINPNYFDNRRQGTLLVSVAGPLMNLFLAFLSLVIIMGFNIDNNFLGSVFIYNVIFGIFNLLPVPPLDGSKILASLLPEKFESFFWKYERYGYIVLLLLIFSNGIDIVLGPAISLVMNSMISSIQLVLNLFS